MASRGQVWLVDLNPTRGHEQAGRRPALVLSTNQFNNGPAGLVLVAPMTSRQRNIPLHVRLDPPEGGVRSPSFIKCEDIRSISTERLVETWGMVEIATLREVEDRVRILLDL